MPLEIRELIGDRDIGAAFPLMRELRDRLREETFVSDEKLGFHFHTSIPSWADVGDLLKLP